MIHLLTILLLIVGQPKNVESDCDGSCANKTYGLSLDLEPNCKEDCPYEATISVFGYDNFNDRLNITLIGHNVDESAELTLGIQFLIGATTNIYICIKYTDGKTFGALNRFAVYKPFGKSFYKNNILHCSWNMTQSNMDYWPLNGTKAAELAKYSNYNISMSVNTTMVTVDTNPKGLPIYARQYLKCCGHTILGNDEYSLPVKQNPYSTDFWFQYLGSRPKVAKIEINMHDNINITTICNFHKRSIDGLFTFKGNTHPIGQWIWFKGKIFDNLCGWTIPDIVEYYAGKIPVQLNSFGVKIIADDKIVYSKFDVNGTSYLSSGISITPASFLMPLMMVSLLF